MGPRVSRTAGHVRFDLWAALALKKSCAIHTFGGEMDKYHLQIKYDVWTVCHCISLEGWYALKLNNQTKHFYERNPVDWILTIWPQIFKKIIPNYSVFSVICSDCCNKHLKTSGYFRSNCTQTRLDINRSSTCYSDQSAYDFTYHVPLIANSESIFAETNAIANEVL